MPANESAPKKFSGTFESNIPVLKKPNFDSLRVPRQKESQGLHDYIEAILKATKGSDGIVSDTTVNPSEGRKNINTIEKRSGNESLSKRNCSKKIKVNESHLLKSSKASENSPDEKKTLYFEKKCHISDNNFGLVEVNGLNLLEVYPSLAIENFLEKLYPKSNFIDKANDNTVVCNSTLSMNFTNFHGSTTTEKRSKVDKLRQGSSPFSDGEEAYQMKPSCQPETFNGSNEEIRILRRHRDIIENPQQVPLKNIIQNKKSMKQLEDNALHSGSFFYRKNESEEFDTLIVENDSLTQRQEFETEDLKNMKRKSKEMLKECEGSAAEALDPLMLDTSNLKKSYTRTLKKLNELVDKTDQNLLLITNRNKELEMVKKELQVKDRVKSSETDIKTADNKLVKLINKIVPEMMNSISENEYNKIIKEEGTSANMANVVLALNRPTSSNLSHTNAKNSVSKMKGEFEVLTSKDTNLIETALKRCENESNVRKTEINDFNESNDKVNKTKRCRYELTKKFCLNQEMNNKSKTKTILEKKGLSKDLISEEKCYKMWKKSDEILDKDVKRLNTESNQLNKNVKKYGCNYTSTNYIGDTCTQYNNTHLHCAELCGAPLKMERVHRQTGSSVSLALLQPDADHSLLSSSPATLRMTDDTQSMTTHQNLQASSLGNLTYAENSVEMEANPEIRNQIVEETNELGGYNEERPEEILAGGGVFSKKNILPLSVRIRKRCNDSSEALKQALETEEKLLVNRNTNMHCSSMTTDVIKTNTTLKNSNLRSLTGSEFSLQQNLEGTTVYLKYTESNIFNVYPFLKNFNYQNHNFVTCVNFLPRNLRTMVRSNIICASSFLNSKFFRTEEVVVGLLSQVSRHHVQKLLLFTEVIRVASTYRLKTYILKTDTLKKVGIFQYPTLISLKLSSKFPKVDDSYLNEKSRYLTVRTISPTKEASVAAASTSLVKLEPNKSNLLINKMPVFPTNEKQKKESLYAIHQDCKTNKSIHAALVQAIEETEESIQLLEQSTSVELPLQLNKLFPWYSVSEPLSSNTCNFDGQYEANHSDKEKEKLHCQLFKMSSEPLFSPSVQFLPNLSVPDVCVLFKGNTVSRETPLVPNIKSNPLNEINSKSMQTDNLFPVKCCEMKHQTSNNEIHPVGPNIKMVDHATSCQLRSESNIIQQNCSTTKISVPKENKKCGKNLIPDDRSSTSSFKSSNEFSESNEKPMKGKKELRSENVMEMKNLQFLRKIFSDLDMFRKKIKLNKQKLFSKENINSKSTNKIACDEKFTNEFEENERKDKTSAKILKTVFKGKESTTELAIGLKDVPMSNISVEKKKVSPNHTKISISISKNQASEFKKSNNRQENNFVVGEEKDSNLHYLPSSVSSNIKKGAGCDIENLSEEEDSSKLHNQEEEKEEEEDDFKSVGSSVSCDSELDSAHKSEMGDSKLVCEEPELSAIKPFQKHRFHFYQKMTNDFNIDRTTRTISRYNVKEAMCKQLEPLRQALTDMQIRMRNIKRDSFLNSHEYYNRALKLAKMSAGYCQCCGNRAVIPEDTYGYYRSIFPRRCSSHQKYYIRNKEVPKSSFYSFHSGSELSDQLHDIDLHQSSSYLMSNRLNKPILNKSQSNVSFSLERF